MLKNFITETFIKGFVPELVKYLWTGETDYSKQKQSANMIVMNDFVSKGYKLRQLRPQLDLRVSGTTVTVATSEDATEEDIGNRIRLVVNVISVSGTATVNIQGTNTEDAAETDWNDIKVSMDSATSAIAITITATGETSGVLGDQYTYYRCKSTGTIDYDCYLVESIYDLLYTYKWLALILYNSSSEDNDQYMIKGKQFDDMYNSLLASANFYVDKDDSGDIAESEKSQAITTRILR